MTTSRPPGRRRFLATVATGGLLGLFAGCFGDDGSSAADEAPGDAQSTETLGDQPYPSDLVGRPAFVDELDTHVGQARFPDPSPSLIPELTKARFVAVAAEDDGEAAYADRIRAIREPVFEPLYRYDAVVVLLSEDRRERLNDTRLDQLRSQAGIDDANVTLTDDPEQIVESLLDERAMTFGHYPNAPIHFINAAESRGLDALEQSPDERAATAPDAHRTYVRQRTRIRAVVDGGREIATAAYEDRIDELLDQAPGDRQYDSASAYADTVAFNAALAAESMLETSGEIVQGP